MKQLIRVPSIVCLSFLLFITSLVAQTSAAIAVQDDGAARAGGNGTVPRVVRYSGMLGNVGQAAPTEGTSAVTTAHVIFALYADEQSSAPLWMETQTVSVDATGKYSVLLGATSSEGLAPELFQSGESRWLGVKSGDAAEQRVLLVSVPYALKAEDADTIAGHKITDFLLTPEAAAAATAAGIAVPRVPTVNVDNGTGGTANQLAKWTNATTLGNSIITDTGTAVGIGVANPAFTIDIKNTDATAAGSNIFRLQTPSVNGAVMHFLSTSANGHDWAFGSNFINGVGEFGVYDYTANTARLFINATGSVGINTSVPQFTMDVQNNDATGAGANIFRMRTPSVNGAVMHFQSTAANGHDWGFGSNFIVGAGEFGFYDYTAGAARVFITGTGNVGIGTTAPGALLDVGGTIKGTALTITGALASGAQTVTGNVTASGTVTATSFVGSGAGLTNLPVSGGTITGVTTGANSGLLGGGTTGTLNLRLLDTCQANQILKWTGTAWTCSNDATTTASGNAFSTTNTTPAINATSSAGVNLINDPVFAGIVGTIPAAIVGQATNTQGTGVGVVGLSNSISSPAIVGWNGSTTGSNDDASGVIGVSDNPIGTGINGETHATSGQNRGVRGKSASPQGFGVEAVGLMGNNGGAGGTALHLSMDCGGGNGCGTLTNPQGKMIQVDGASNGLMTMDVNGATVFTTFSSVVTPVTINQQGGGTNILVAQAGGTNKFRVDNSGKGYFNNGTQTGGADFAESFAVEGVKEKYSPGDVLVIDPSADRRVTFASKSYSTFVAGIYATKPGVLATPYTLDEQDKIEREVPMAVVGVVPCKVTSQNGAIHIGDLLVTSSKPGYAMKGTDRKKMLGAVVGKALQALPNGEGVIQVLVTLQ